MNHKKIKSDCLQYILEHFLFYYYFLIKTFTFEQCKIKQGCKYHR